VNLEENVNAAKYIVKYDCSNIYQTLPAVYIYIKILNDFKF